MLRTTQYTAKLQQKRTNTKYKCIITATKSNIKYGHTHRYSNHTNGKPGRRWTNVQSLRTNWYGIVIHAICSRLQNTAHHGVGKKSMNIIFCVHKQQQNESILDKSGQIGMSMIKWC